MNVANRTDAKHLAFPMKDRDGRARVIIVAKYTYRISANGRVERDDDGPEPHPIDDIKERNLGHDLRGRR